MGFADAFVWLLLTPWLVVVHVAQHASLSRGEAGRGAPVAGLMAMGANKAGFEYR